MAAIIIGSLFLVILKASFGGGSGVGGAAVGAAGAATGTSGFQFFQEFADIIGNAALMGLIGASVYKWIEENPDWQNILDIVTTFAEEYTPLIDTLLMKGLDVTPNYSKISSNRRISDNQLIPHVGTHYYYPGLNPDANVSRIIQDNMNQWIHTWRFNIVLKKLEISPGNNSRYYYKAYYYFFKANVQCFADFERVLMNRHLPMTDIFLIRTLKIDTSDGQPKLFYSDKICKQARVNQIQAMNFILNHYNQGGRYPNTEVMIYGEMGVGKTHTALLLKRLMEELNRNMNVKVIVNFDPDVIGVDVDKMILSNATANSPVILVIDEIDKIYKKVLDQKQIFGDNRTQHTKDVTSFHRMLDSIGDNPHVITLMTTNKSPRELYQMKRGQYRTFFRPGRLHFFLYMNDNTTVQIPNNLDGIMNSPQIPNQMPNDADNISNLSETQNSHKRRFNGDGESSSVESS